MGWIRRFSKKRARLQVKRRLFVEELLADHPWCDAVVGDGACHNRGGNPLYWRNRAVDVHETLNRSQGGALIPEDLPADVDPSTHFKVVCRSCHDWITEHPRLAHALGLHRWAWEGYVRKAS